MKPLLRSALFLLAAAPNAAAAADHADSPRAAGDPAADITDLYAWMIDDGTKLVLAMDIAAERFSDAVQYVFHTTSANAYGQSPTPLDIICAFDAAQKITCWAGDDDAVTGDARNLNGVTSDSGRLRVYAGPRSDPFFFNASGFSATIAAVRAAAGSLTFDTAGCPAVDAATSAALVQQLATDASGGAARNLFRGRVVSALVVVIDKAIVTKGGPITSVWASTRR